MSGWSGGEGIRDASKESPPLWQFRLGPSWRSYPTVRKMLRVAFQSSQLSKKRLQIELLYRCQSKVARFCPEAPSYNSKPSVWTEALRSDGGNKGDVLVTQFGVPDTLDQTGASLLSGARLLGFVCAST